MNETPAEGEEKQSIEGGDEGDPEQPEPSDDEDDCEGYFLEPVGGNISIAEKIAEANKKLQEEADEEGNENRPRKVQFSEELVNFEASYYSDDDCTQSAQNSVISEEDLDLKIPPDKAEEPKSENKSLIPADLEKKFKDKKSEDDIPEEIESEIIPKEIVEDLHERNPKFILILLPKEQNSSCESIIGEEILEEKNEVEEDKPEAEKPSKTKIARPKSAKKSCEVSKISPNLGFTSSMERKSWQSNRNPLLRPKSKVERSDKENVFMGKIEVQIKGKVLKKINIDDSILRSENLKRCGGDRPKSCCSGKDAGKGDYRPQTAPMRRTCCVIKTELPQYNGLRSEYGLSAEQLQERKQKALENRLKKKQEQLKKRQEEMKKKTENEETFQRWLFNKTKKAFKKKSSKLRDTLTRSDVYIQTHASYAANRSVPYSLDLSLIKKNNGRKRETRLKKSKTIVVEKLLDNMTPHFKRSFNIYLGLKS